MRDGEVESLLWSVASATAVNVHAHFVYHVCWWIDCKGSVYSIGGRDREGKFDGRWAFDLEVESVDLKSV